METTIMGSRGFFGGYTGFMGFSPVDTLVLCFVAAVVSNCALLQFSEYSAGSRAPYTTLWFGI